MLLNKFTAECIFPANKRLIKQIDGCPKGGLISFVLSDIYVYNIEEDIVAPSKCLSTSVMWMIPMSKEKNKTGKLYNASISYHQNINLILELDPMKFLDTEIIPSNSKITIQLCNKMKKFHVLWT